LSIWSGNKKKTSTLTGNQTPVFQRASLAYIQNYNKGSCCCRQWTAVCIL